VKFQTSETSTPKTSSYQTEKEDIDLGKQPLYIILEGNCIVVNPLDGFEVAILGRGDCFGDSDLLRYPGIDFMGEVVAGDNGVQCLVLDEPERVITF